MTEFIIRLTAEQEQLLRAYGANDPTPDDAVFILSGFYRSVRDQAIDAIQLYDRLVAEAKAASDE